jgi:hypothetical protein
MCRAICIASPQLDAPAECSSPTSVLPTSRPRRSAVEKVHYEQDAYEPRTYPTIPTLEGLYPPGGFEQRWHQDSTPRFLCVFWRRCGPGSSGNSSVFRLVATTILRGSSTPLPWKLIFRYALPLRHASRVNDSRANVAYRVAMHPMLTLTIHTRRRAGWRQCTQRPVPSCCSQRARRPPTQCARRSTRTCRRAWT